MRRRARLVAPFPRLLGFRSPRCSPAEATRSVLVERPGPRPPRSHRACSPGIQGAGDMALCRSLRNPEWRLLLGRGSASASEPPRSLALCTHCKWSSRRSRFEACFRAPVAGNTGFPRLQHSALGTVGTGDRMTTEGGDAAPDRTWPVARLEPTHGSAPEAHDQACGAQRLT